MITLEEQLRRYAADVAGPALADPPADLVEVGRPHHRGRWVLVAALALFICGLTWLATRPSDTSAPPAVDVPVTSTDPTAVQWQPSGGVSFAPVGEKACSDDPTVVGILLDGTAGESLCVTASTLSAGRVLLRVFESGRELVRYRLAPCAEAVAYPPFAVQILGGPILAIAFVEPTAGYARLDGHPEDPPFVEPIDLTALPGTRVVVTPVPDPFAGAGVTGIGADGQELNTGVGWSVPTCLADDGTPSATTLPEG